MDGISESYCTYDGQHIASVLEWSLVDVTTVENPSGQVRGRMLTAVWPD